MLQYSTPIIPSIYVCYSFCRSPLVSCQSNIQPESILSHASLNNQPAIHPSIPRHVLATKGELSKKPFLWWTRTCTHCEMIKSRILLPPICLHKGLCERFAPGEEKPVDATSANSIILLLLSIECSVVDACAQFLWASYSNEQSSDSIDLYGTLECMQSYLPVQHSLPRGQVNRTTTITIP